MDFKILHHSLNLYGICSSCEGLDESNKKKILVRLKKNNFNSLREVVADKYAEDEKIDENFAYVPQKLTKITPGEFVNNLTSFIRVCFSY